MTALIPCMTLFVPISLLMFALGWWLGSGHERQAWLAWDRSPLRQRIGYAAPTPGTAENIAWAIVGADGCLGGHHGALMAERIAQAIRNDRAVRYALAETA